MRREIFADAVRLFGKYHGDTIIDAGNLVDSLLEAELFEEARSLLREYIPVAQRTLGDRNYLPFDLRSAYARAISRDTSSSLSDVHEGVAILEDVVCTTQRVFGTTHPNFIEFRQDLEGARMRAYCSQCISAIFAATWCECVLAANHPVCDG